MNREHTRLFNDVFPFHMGWIPTLQLADTKKTPSRASHGSISKSVRQAIPYP